MGLGGHATMFCSHMNTHDQFIGIDRDVDNLNLAKQNLDDSSPHISKHLIHSSFADIDSILDNLNIKNINFILYDLGVSSAHYDDGDR